MGNFSQIADEAFSLLCLLSYAFHHLYRWSSAIDPPLWLRHLAIDTLRSQTSLQKSPIRCISILRLAHPQIALTQARVKQLSWRVFGAITLGPRPIITQGLV